MKSILKGACRVLAMCLAVAAALPAFDAQITTDKKRYAVGETMVLSGSGFTAGFGVNISVLRPDHATDYVLGVIADAGGAFTANYTPSDPVLPGRYKFTATDSTFSATTASTEADSIGIDFRQCAQNDKIGNTLLGLGNCNWLNSSLGQGNSKLYEGMATEQQLLVTTMSGSTHTISVGIQATKSGNHAYDFLVSDAKAFGAMPDSTLNSQQASLNVGITLNLNRCGGQLGTQAQAACNALISGATSSNTVDIDVPDDPYVSHDGSTQSRIDAYESKFGNRTVRLYTDALITGTPTMALVHMSGKSSGSPLTGNDDTGDTFIWYTITWTGNATNAMLVAGADIAIGGDGTGRSWGPGRGAAGISGDPYHFYLLGADGAGGSLDNQISSSPIILPARLTLIKTVTKDNGGTAVETEWTLTATGPDTISGKTGDATITNKTVAAGAYALTESGPSGYTAGAWSCVGGTQTGSTITLAEDQSATCTINNDDKPASLTIIKRIINANGGTKVVGDFGITTSAGVLAFGAGVADGANTLKYTTTALTGLSAGVAYSLHEDTVTGYTEGPWSCTGASGAVVSNAQTGSVTLGLGDTATCTITNNDQPAHLTLVKSVVNNFGTPAAATLWTLTAGGTGLTPVSGAGGASADVKAGTYTLGETGTVAGYTNGTSYVCTGTGTQGSATNQNGVTSIALSAGDTATCTITNTAQAPHLKLVKNVVNAFGTAAAATNWTLSAAGSTPISGAGGVDSDVNDGTYTLSETGSVTGYTNGTSYVCTGTGTQGDGTHVTVHVGQSETCTITNTARAPHLTLVKSVVNNFGTPAAATLWTLTAGGTGLTPVSGAGGASSDVKAGTYTLGETGTVFGYTNGTTYACTGTGTVVDTTHITLDLGQSETCTITNTAIAPRLTLLKQVTNSYGGKADATKFQLSAAGPTSISGVVGDAAVTNAIVNAGVYTLTETSLYGYKLQSLTCVGGSLANGKLTLNVGDSATCTFVNVDLPGTIIVKKVTKPLNTGSFGFTTTGLGYSGFALNGGTQNSQALSAGSYTVQESTQLGWILTGIGGSTDPSTPYNCTITGSGGSTGVGDLNTLTATISLKNGDTVTCVFENTGSGVTRTQGFWATHPQLAQIAWFGGTAFKHTFPGVTGTPGIGDITLCGRSLDGPLLPHDIGKVMGGFWSSVSSTSTGTKRSALDQGRMQLLQQLLAAELNASAFGTVPSGGNGQFALWETAYCGTNTKDISTAQQQAGSFNSIGDSSTFTPGTAADSKNARAIANYVFWDILP